MTSSFCASSTKSSLRRTTNGQITSPYSCTLNAPRRMSSATCQIKFAFSRKLFGVIECVSLSNVMDWEIIALNWREKEDFQLIQYANQTAELGSIHDNRG